MHIEVAETPSNGLDWHKSEALAYRQLLSKARRAGNQAAVESLEMIGPPPCSNLRSTGIRSNLAAHFEAGAPDGPRLMNMPFSAPGYTNADARNWLQGLDSSQEHFFGTRMDGPFAREDLTALGPDFAAKAATRTSRLLDASEGGSQRSINCVD
ncbi:MAG: hypothetical protein ACRETR_10710 [Steroidobacteraceae bacterium]